MEHFDKRFLFVLFHSQTNVLEYVDIGRFDAPEGARASNAAAAARPLCLRLRHGESHRPPLLNLRLDVLDIWLRDLDLRLLFIASLFSLR